MIRTIFSILAFTLTLVVSSAQDFDELHVSGPCRLTIVQSDAISGHVDCHGDESAVTFRHAGNALYLAVDPAVVATGRKNVTLYVSSRLLLLDASGRVEVVADSLVREGQLAVVASGAASVSVGKISAANINVSLSGSGKLMVSGPLTASTVNFSLTGSGCLTASEIIASRMTVNQRGSGKMSFTGSARDCYVVARGSGSVDLRSFVAASMDLRLYGQGKIFYPSGIPVKLAGDVEHIIQVKPYQPL